MQCRFESFNNLCLGFKHFYTFESLHLYRMIAYQPGHGYPIKHFSAKWAPTNYKWNYSHYKQGYNPSYSELSGVLDKLQAFRINIFENPWGNIFIPGPFSSQLCLFMGGYLCEKKSGCYLNSGQVIINPQLESTPLIHLK